MYKKRSCTNGVLPHAPLCTYYPHLIQGKDMTSDQSKMVDSC